MTFLLDNDIPNAISRVLKQAGHQVNCLREVLPRESDDISVLNFACARQAVLITCNRNHFLELARTRPHAGIVVLIRRQTRIAECSRFLRLIQSAGESGIRNNINFA